MRIAKGNIMGNTYQDNLAAAASLAHIAPLGSLREKSIRTTRRWL